LNGAPKWTPWWVGVGAFWGLVGTVAAYGISLVLYLVTHPEVFLNGITPAVFTEAMGPWALVGSVVGLWFGLLGVPLYLSRRYGTSSLARDFKVIFKWRDIPLALALAALLRGGEALVTWFLTSRGVDLSGSDNASALISRNFTVPSVLMLLAVCFGAPFVEELFFRGLALTSMRWAWGLIPAVLCSSLLFSLAHFQGGPGGWFLVLWTFLIGVLFSVLTLKSGRLGPSMTTHMVYNTSGVLLVLLLAS
jgi:membrane protease YdiL (CAAX protease family)